MSITKHNYETPNLMFIGEPYEKKFVHHVAAITEGAKVAALFRIPTTLAEIEMLCKKRGITGVLTTSVDILKKLAVDAIEEPKLSNYGGSYFKRNGIEYVILHPLAHIYSINHAMFLAKRYASKLTRPWDWLSNIPFKWKQFSTIEEFKKVLIAVSSADLCAVDIETQKNLLIDSCSFTCGYISKSGEVSTMTYVLDLFAAPNTPEDNAMMYDWLKQLCETRTPKIFQNGIYDIAYLGRYNIDVVNYLWDTAQCMHAWYSELPKSLDAQQAFFVREAHYWKDQSKAKDRTTGLAYNARDTWATLWAFIGWLIEAPQWAKNNYLIKFPVVYPNHMMGMRGIKRNAERLASQVTKIETQIANAQKELELCTWEGLNSNSPKQVKLLCQVLGIKDPESTDEKHLELFGDAHALNERIFGYILEIRGLRKLIGTYLSEEKDFSGRILYQISPWATDTGRNASKEHPFWTGSNIQNVPRGAEVKCTYEADDDFFFAEVDLSQAESRGTGYISGDEKLIDAVENSPDFHSHNASSFFGIPFDKIFSIALKKVLDKALRDLAKRVNHGANYNMGPNVLLTTMGRKAVRKAQKLLGLPKSWTLKMVCEHLLAQFHKTYPKIKSVFYAGVIKDVKSTKMLVGATGWTRYCFGKPWENKADLNALVAHPPQSLNGMQVDKAVMKVFYELALPHYDNFRMCAQIHDSIFFQYRKGHHSFCEEVRKRMEIPLAIKGYDGVTRTCLVPADIKDGKIDKETGEKIYAKFWSETE